MRSFALLLVALVVGTGMDALACGDYGWLENEDGWAVLMPRRTRVSAEKDRGKALARSRLVSEARSDRAERFVLHRRGKTHTLKVDGTGALSVDDQLVGQIRGTKISVQDTTYIVGLDERGTTQLDFQQWRVRVAEGETTLWNGTYPIEGCGDPTAEGIEAARSGAMRRIAAW